MEYGITRNAALAFLRGRLKGPSLINHSLASELALRARQGVEGNLGL